MRQDRVTFYSPGTLFAETTTRPVPEWGPRLAVGMAETVLERYDARPYGFRFTTVLSAAPVPDGEGGMLEVASREVARSGMYFLGGRLRTVDEVEADALPDEQILLANMRCNDWSIVVENTNSWKTIQPFEEGDVVVDARGEVVERGDAPERVAYRARKAAEHWARVESTKETP